MASSGPFCASQVSASSKEGNASQVVRSDSPGQVNEMAATKRIDERCGRRGCWQWRKDHVTNKEIQERRNDFRKMVAHSFKGVNRVTCRQDLWECTFPAKELTRNTTNRQTYQETTTQSELGQDESSSWCEFLGCRPKVRYHASSSSILAPITVCFVNHGIFLERGAKTPLPPHPNKALHNLTTSPSPSSPPSPTASHSSNS